MNVDDSILSVDQVSLKFGGLQALTDVSLRVEAGQVVALIGPNGAGKTSLFNCVTGAYQATSGSVSLEGRDITGLSPHHVGRTGMARTFQNMALFPSLTVVENIMVGDYRHGRSGMISGLLRLPQARRDEERSRSRASDVIDRLELGHVALRRPTELPYGIQKKVELGRALMQGPRLLLLDEPMAGMSTAEKDEMTQIVSDVNQDFDCAVLIVDHDVPAIMSLAEVVYVLDFGVLISSGSSSEVQADPVVIEAYIGA